MTRSRLAIGILIGALVGVLMIGVSVGGKFYEAAKKTVEQYSCNPLDSAATGDMVLPTSTAAIAVKQGASTKKLVYSRDDSGRPIYATAEQIRVATAVTQAVYGFSKIEPQYKQRAAIIALITAAVESDWRDIKTLNPDGSTSTGVMQQRDFWGSYEQRTDIKWATIAFLQGGVGGTKNAGLLDTKGWKTREMGAVAQDVQVSAYPDRYSKRIDLAKRFLALMNITTDDTLAGTFNDPSLEDETELGGQPNNCANSCVGNFTSTGTIRVGTWNGFYKNNPDGPKLEQGVRAIGAHADVIGLQEFGRSPERRRTAAEALRGDFQMQEHKNAVPILWRPSVFNELDQGVVDIADTKKQISWVKLEVKETHKVIFMINQHIQYDIDSKGRPNGNKSHLRVYKNQMSAFSKLVKKLKAENPDAAFFATGDYNVDATRDAKVQNSIFPYMQMKAIGFLSNWNILGPPQSGTHGKRLIDYVWSLISDQVQPVGQVVLDKFGSDHSPVAVAYSGSIAVNSETTVKPVNEQPADPSQPSPPPQVQETPETDGCTTGTNLSAVLKAAYAQKGKAYLYGSKPGDNTFDCSELTQFAYAAGGVELPRRALQQYRATKKYAVSRGELKKGDLLFFNTDDNNEKDDHVAFYWGKDPQGNDLLYDAPRTGLTIGVRELTDWYWQRFTGAARPIQSESKIDSSLPSASGKWLEPSWGITSSYGMRYHPVKHVNKLHDGTDYGAPCGANVKSINYGQVVRIYNEPGGGGHIVELSHGRYHSLYEHLGSDTVSVGDHINRGQVVGKASDTGSASGCHLHLTIKDMNKPDKGWGTQTINPVTFFKMMRQDDFSPLEA